MPRVRPSDHSLTVRRLGLLVFTVVLGCGPAAPPPAAPQAPRALEPALPSRPRNTLYRDEVNAVIQSGLGAFLSQHVDMEPTGEQDASGKLVRFEGFRLEGMRPASDWMTFDLAPGDVIVSANGESVAHYDDVLAVLESLRTSSELRLGILRSGAPATIVLPIVERPGAASTRAKPTASASPASSAPASPTAPAATAAPGAPKP